MQRNVIGGATKAWPGRLRSQGGVGAVQRFGQAPASADTASAVGVGYTQAEVQAILDELRDLKTQLRAAGVLAP